MPEASTTATPSHYSGHASLNVRATQTADPGISTAIASRLAVRLSTLDLFDRLAAIRLQISGRIVFTTSFGLEDQAITHAIFSRSLAIDVATLDTGRLFPETHEVWAQTERRYNNRILAFTPGHSGVEALIAKQGIDGLRSSVTARQECCAVRKIAPLTRALDGS